MNINKIKLEILALDYINRIYYKLIKVLYLMQSINKIRKNAYAIK